MGALNVNILVLTGSLHVGGAETAMLNLVEVLARDEVRRGEKINVHLCAFGVESAFGEASLSSRAERLPLPFEKIVCRRFYDPGSWWRIRRYVKHHDIELIHSFLASADIVANVIGRLERIPVVTSLRNVPESYLRARRDLVLLLRSVVIPGASRLVALSDSIRREWIDRFAIEESRIVTIPNAASIEAFLGIPLERTPQGHTACRNRPLTVTTVGRLMPQKAHDDFIRAAAQVLERCPETRFRIVGQGALKDSLVALATSLGVERSIEFRGLRSDIDRELATADVFVLSSHWEGMSVAAIEAMAAGLPLVLTEVGANPDLVEDGVHGLLVPPARPDRLADAIVTLLRSPEQRLAMGRRARDKAARRFSAESNYRAYLELYRTLLERSSAGS